MTKMVDAALSSAGGKVVLATSSDEKHTPENIIDGRTDTFWMTTGMFPQQFIISFSNPIKINTVTIQCYNELQHVEGQLQTEEFALSQIRATHLRFTIKSGFDHFVSVHRVMVEGSASNI
ncbi:intraflagellar transport protein 25 homolog isoform X3 [Protopterus annectens]|uniref:intraflagellar transport protein 25 homolog isoform X3 n=1 Tax=Protopterus annectens TaxID=7888 RepID=UPI001CFB0416|nr:intraflagellar transport protein 25 homolog isoform X3 [Protopterus annectens]